VHLSPGVVTVDKAAGGGVEAGGRGV